ncbi:hypothetical protein U1Q18_022546, partial [Sarracenia purpurea var. burkii]
SPDHEPPISTSFEPTQEAEPPQETSKTPAISLEEPAHVEPPVHIEEHAHVAHVEPLSAPSPHAAATFEEHAIQDEPPVDSPAALAQDSSPP